MKLKIYVASSWRNYLQLGTVAALRKLGHEVYDFRNPKLGNHRSPWKTVDLAGELWGAAEYILALQSPTAEEGFRFNMEALEWCDTLLLVLPCGRSAHLEAGYAKGLGKKLFIVLDDDLVPELMYKMADHIFPGFNSMLDFFTLNENP